MLDRSARCTLSSMRLRHWRESIPSGLTLAMRDHSNDSTRGDAGGGVARPRGLGAVPAARGDWLSPLLIALLGAMALGLIFFLAPLMARGRAGWGKQSGDQAGGAGSGQNGNGPTGNLPLGPRQDVALGDAPVRGSRTFLMMIVEFADYQCPYCQQMHPELKILQQELAGKVAVAFKDFPLAMHANAEKAAEAARCAGEQGKYWDFHDVLFHNSDNLEVAQIKQYAHDLKLNQSNFEACLDSGKEAAAVQKDQAQGKQLGVRATPSFFFNGRLFTGAMDSFYPARHCGDAAENRRTRCSGGALSGVARRRAGTMLGTLRECC